MPALTITQRCLLLLFKNKLCHYWCSQKYKEIIILYDKSKRICQINPIKFYISHDVKIIFWLIYNTILFNILVKLDNYGLFVCNNGPFENILHIIHVIYFKCNQLGCSKYLTSTINIIVILYTFTQVA